MNATISVQVAARHGTAPAGASAPTPMEGMEGAGGAVASQALSLDLDQPEPADVEACYAAELGAVQISDWDSTAPGAYNRYVSHSRSVSVDSMPQSLHTTSG